MNTESKADKTCTKDENSQNGITQADMEAAKEKSGTPHRPTPVGPGIEPQQ